MENKFINYLSLKAEYHDRGKPLKGLTIVKSYLEVGREKELSILLDHHNNYRDGYRGEELEQRFQIDSLIEFYNLLLVASTAGYIPLEIESDILDEINMVLGSKAIQPYYEIHYPYKMVTYTLNFAFSKPNLSIYAIDDDSIVFNTFIALSLSLKNDKDVERFLGMLDYVLYGGTNIDSVISALNDEKRIESAFTSNAKNELDKGIMGFVKYSVFLSQLLSLLKASEHNPLFQSAMWMFHGYYLDRMNNEMNLVFKKAFENMEVGLTNPDTLNSLFDEMVEGFKNKIDIEERDELKEMVIDSFRSAREDMIEILKPNWGTALKTFFEGDLMVN